MAVPTLSAIFLLVCLAVRSLAALPPGYQAFYNLEFDRAVAAFQQEVHDHPSEPNPYNHLAHALLYRRLQAEGALESDLVGAGNSFLKRPKLAMPAAELQSLEEALATSIRLCTEMLRRNPNDAEALYALGVAYGHRGNTRLLVQKAYWDALRDASRSRAAHDKLRALQPQLVDARLIPGLHDYIIGSLPRTMRWLGAVAGLHGDKEAGLRALEDVSRHGERTRVEAKVMLVLLYRREKRQDAALPLLQDLSRAFPRNPLFTAETVRALADANRRPEAWSALEDIESHAAESRMPRSTILSLRAMLQRRDRQYDAALETLKQITSTTETGAGRAAGRAWLQTGQIYDLKGQRPQAREAYERAMTTAPQTDVAEESRRWLATPYRE